MSGGEDNQTGSNPKQHCSNLCCYYREVPLPKLETRACNSSYVKYIQHSSDVVNGVTQRYCMVNVTAK